MTALTRREFLLNRFASEMIARNIPYSTEALFERLKDFKRDSHPGDAELLPKTKSGLGRALAKMPQFKQVKVQANGWKLAA